MAPINPLNKGEQIMKKPMRSMLLVAAILSLAYCITDPVNGIWYAIGGGALIGIYVGTGT